MGDGDAVENGAGTRVNAESEHFGIVGATFDEQPKRIVHVTRAGAADEVGRPVAPQVHGPTRARSEPPLSAGSARDGDDKHRKGYLDDDGGGDRTTNRAARLLDHQEWRAPQATHEMKFVHLPPASTASLKGED